MNTATASNAALDVRFVLAAASHALTLDEVAEATGLGVIEAWDALDEEQARGKVARRGSVVVRYEVVQ